MPATAILLPDARAGHGAGRDIHPKSPTDRLSDSVARLSADDLAQRIDLALASAALGMSTAFIAKALGRPGTKPRTLTLEQIIDLLDIDGYQETFVRRSQIPSYLLELTSKLAKPTPVIDGRKSTVPRIELGNARDLIRRLAPGISPGRRDLDAVLGHADLREHAAGSNGPTANTVPTASSRHRRASSATPSRSCIS